MTTHIGRSWFGHPLEDACPCPQEPCGLVDSSRAVDSCPQHRRAAAKTIRQRHSAETCPGPRQRLPEGERPEPAKPEPGPAEGDLVARIVAAILAEARAAEPTEPPDRLLTYAGGLRRAARIAQTITKEKSP